MSFVVPIGWCSATLEDVAIWAAGGTPSRANTHFFSGNIPWIKTGELGSRFIAEAEEHISEEAIAASSAKIFPSGSVALAMYGATIGKASILAIDAATNQACAVGIPDGVSSEFLYYFLLSQRNLFEEAGKGGAQPNISQGIVKAWPLLVPPQAEQGRIIDKLEELLCDLDSGMAELKAAQRKLVQYRQSLMKAALEGTLTADWRAARAQSGELQETGTELLQRILNERRARWEAKQLAKFTDKAANPPKGWRDKYPPPVPPKTVGLHALPVGWAWASLDMIGEIASGVAKGTKRSSATITREVPYLRVANVQRGYLDLTQIKTIEATEADIQELRLQPGDVLFNEGGDLDKLGRGSVWQGEVEECIHQNHVFRLRPYLSGTPSELISHHGNTFGKDWFKTAGKQTTNLASINMKMLREFPVPIAPELEGLEILERLSPMLDIAAAQEKSIELGLKQAAAQRKNILKAAFNGQLVPQDPNDEPASVLLERIRAERVAADAKRAGKNTRKTRERT